MSVLVIGATAAGLARLYHTSIKPDGSTDEHFFRARVRRSPTTFCLFCPYCDSITTYSRGGGDRHARTIARAIAAGRLVPLDVVDADARDPLTFALEDSIAGAPATASQDGDERRAARAAMRTAYVESRPNVAECGRIDEDDAP